MMDELLEQFLIESRELVALAAKDLATLARDPMDGAAIDSAFRAIHTLKGSFAIFALSPAERLLHAAEDVLEQARKGAALLRPATLDALTACLDQTDRWIDAMERDSALPGDADERASAVLALLRGHVADQLPEGSTSEPPSQAANWLTALVAREARQIDQSITNLIAFRYRPDADCFFRGEDPLAVVEAIPDLVALAILPAAGSWPRVGELDPFACLSLIEGLSAADEADLRAAFRLQPDQVEFAALPHASRKPDGEKITADGTLLRVESTRIDALADGLRDLAIAINSLAPLASDMGQLDRAMAARLRSAQASIERVATSLHGHLAQIRLVPLEGTLRRLPRAAREIAEALGKSVAFTMEGETIEVDKQIAEGLFEPLLHLLRNAIDHGIEMPAARQAAGKPPQGRLRLTFARDGDAITATLSDDGTGIDPARIHHMAVERGLLDQDAFLSDDESALRLIFEPGFSTAAAITDLSGRGVGMDAVQAAVTRLRGTITVESKVGSGTSFHMRFPAHALITQLLVVEIDGDRFGIPFEQVRETLRIDASAIKPIGLGQVCVLRGSAIPVVDLAGLLGLPSITAPTARLVVTHVEGSPVALRVGNISQRLDTVIRPHGGVLGQARGMLGSAIMGDGSVLLILDVQELLA